MEKSYIVFRETDTNDLFISTFHTESDAINNAKYNTKHSSDVGYGIIFKVVMQTCESYHKPHFKNLWNISKKEDKLIVRKYK